MSVSVTNFSPQMGAVQLPTSYQVQLIGTMRVGRVSEERIPTAAANVRLQSGDSLLMVGTSENRERLLAEQLVPDLCRALLKKPVV